MNSTGNITEELAIRFPEVQGHLVSIANGPDGEIYVGGENLYKLESIDRDRNKLTNFINIVRENNLQVNGLSVDLSSKVLSLDFIIKNNETLSSTLDGSPFLQIKVPKALLGGIYDVTSEKFNKSSTPANKVIEEFKTKETMKVSNAGDTVVDIKIKGVGVDGENDKILIQGLTSSLVQAPNRPISILR